MRTTATLPTALLAVAIAAPAALAAEPVIISEIMYNPASHEGGFPGPDGQANPPRSEWVEIYNAGAEPVDVSGWRLGDEDGKTSPLPDGTTLAAGAALVLTPATTEQFKAAWGEDVPVVHVDGWDRDGLSNLANSPSDTNEILVLMTAEEVPVDQVNYDDENGWPSDRPDGASIYVLPGHLTPSANDVPTAWARSADGTHGGRMNTKTDVFDGEDHGSPGVVSTEE